MKPRLYLTSSVLGESVNTTAALASQDELRMRWLDQQIAAEREANRVWVRKCAWCARTFHAKSQTQDVCRRCLGVGP